MHKRSALHQLFSQICEALSVHVTENSTLSAQVRRIFIPFTAMSTALVSAFYDVDDVLYQNRINSNMTRSAVVNMEPPRKITGMTNTFVQHHQQSHHQQLSQQNQFRNRTGSISSTSSVQSDNSGYSLNSSSMSMGSPSSTSSMISSLGGSMPSSPVDYRKQLDRSVSEPVGTESRSKDVVASKQDMVNKTNQTNINSSRYKTELCRPFEENGYCKYGDKCQFAHGAQELRSLNRHPKYKTELCRTYHTIGFCPYGPRCHFIHNDEERRLAQQNQQQGALQSLKQLGSQPTQPQTTTTPASPSHPQPQFSAGQPSQVVPQHHVAGPPRAPQQQSLATLQHHHLRPKSLNFNLLQMQRDSLGSTADSPPSSVTDSPTLSPTFFSDEMLIGSAFSPIPASAPATLQQSSAFPFQDLGVMPAVPAPVPNTSVPTQQVAMPPSPAQQPAASMMSPLNVQTDQMMTLAAQIHALNIANQRNNNMNTNNDALLRESLDLLGVFAPPSPPESLASSTSSSDNSISGTCGSPLEVSRSLRLPIFSKLSCSDDSD